MTAVCIHIDLYCYQSIINVTFMHLHGPKYHKSELYIV